MKRRAADARGFTLLEVILAASLMTVLTLAVYRAVAMHHVQVDAGRQIAEEAQLSRALAERIRHDVRSAFTRWKRTQRANPNTATSTTGAASATDPSTDGMTEEDDANAAIAAEYRTPSGGVRGYPDSITLVTRVPPADLDFTNGGNAASGGSATTDVRMVRYWLARPGSSTDGSNLAGLVREELYRLPDPKAAPDPRAWARAEVLAEEVTNLAIRYFDGATWREAWDNTNQTAPRAIEMLLERAGPGGGAATIQRILVAPPDVVPPTDAAPGATTGASSSATGGGTPTR